MKVIVASMSYRLRDFIKKYQFASRVIVIDKMCKVKTIKGECDVIIPFAGINEYGLINNTEVNLEELLMSLDVKNLKFGNSRAANKFAEIAKKYNVELTYLDLKNLPTNMVL